MDNIEAIVYLDGGIFSASVPSIDVIVYADTLDELQSKVIEKISSCDRYKDADFIVNRIYYN